MKKLFLLSFLLILSASINAQDVPKVKITDLEKKIAQSAHPLVLVFWASWCKPCIEEIPEFEKTVKDFAADSVEVLLVSVDMPEDYPSSIIKTYRLRHFVSPMAWLDETDANYFCPKIDPKWSGAVPATLLVNRPKGQRKFFEQPLTGAELKTQLMAILGSGTH